MAGVEAPPHLRPLREVGPRRRRVIVGTDVCPHEWMARHVEHVIYRAP